MPLEEGKWTPQDARAFRNWFRRALLVRISGVMACGWTQSALKLFCSSHGCIWSSPGTAAPQLPPFSNPHNQESAPLPILFFHRPHLVNLQVLGTHFLNVSNLMPLLHSLTSLLPTCTFLPRPITWDLEPSVSHLLSSFPSPPHTPGQSDVSES